MRFHIGTADVGARVVSGDGALAPGERKLARVILDEPVVLRAGDRFVLRFASPAATIGGGTVVDPYALRRARPWSSEATVVPATRLDVALREAGDAGLDVATLPVRLGVPPRDVTDLLNRADVLTIGGRAFATSVAAALEERLVRLVADAHRAKPLEIGVSLQEVRSRLAATAELVDAVLASAAAHGCIESSGGVVRAAGWTPRLTDAQRRALVDIEETIRLAGSEPPSVAELTPRFGADVPDLLRLLERDGRVVAVEPERYYAAASVATLVDRLRTNMAPGREYSPAELRDLLGFSRKFLIPFLEYCDRRGFTTRGTTGRRWHGT